MLSNIINNAYINLLSCVALRTNDAITTTDYWTLWPKSSMSPSEDVRSLVQAFYQSILCTDAPVFYRSGFVCALSKALFLSPEFRNSNETGQIAYNFLNAVHEGDSKFMDLPFDLYRSFQEFGGENIEKLNNRIISKFNFFKKYFFPMINRKYWRQPRMTEMRNKLIMEALNDVEMHELVKNATCIPVECVDILRKPADLVLKTGSISDMFHGNDGRFITPEFLCFTETLRKLGMMIDKIPSTLLIERAQSVQSGNKKQSLLRSNAILKYLNGSIQNHINILDELKTIHFLPFMIKPSDWPLSWKGNTIQCEIFLSPSSLFSPFDKTVVGSVGYILNTMGNTYSEEFLRNIGIRNVQIEDVVEQMKVLINANLISSVGLQNLCERLYDRLDKALENPSELLSFLKTCRNKRIISVKTKMIEPSNVAFTVIGDCRPYLYKMPKEFAKYKRLWSFIEVEDKFDRKTLLSVLYDLSRYTKQMSQKETLSIVDVLRNLSNRLQSDGVNLSTLERSNLYIPDIDCKMRNIDHVCYEDGQFVYNDNAYIIHGEITEQIKRDLGIMSKRQLFLIRYGCPLPFGQNEPLVTRLKGIISAYPRDHSVLNELLQNADDAGASEVHFVYDLRQHGTEHILDDRCKVLQGPALCVFNNSCFSDADIKGIQSLGEGSKRNDRTKTGQFGVGFNAVYHLTDAPSFLTKGPTTPDNGAVCIFDPHCWYLPRFATPTNPEMMLTLEKFKSKYRDSYGGYLQDILPADVGTWFRLPLRTENEDFKSEISEHCILETDMKYLLKKMKQQISTSLLFLSSIQKISISYIEPNETKLSKTFSVNLSMCEEDRHNFKTFASHMRKEFKMLKNKRKKINEMAFKEITYTAKLNDNAGNVDIWIMCQTFGFEDKNLIPQVVVESSDNGELGFLPRGGTAFKFNVKPTHGLRRKDGTAFCSLPLPISTRLPCHINGHFSVHSDRSQIFCGKNKDDERYIWNKLLFKEVVAHSYASCIEYAKHTLLSLMVENSAIEYLNVFFECFPALSEVSSDFLKDFVYEIFRNIATRELQVFPVFPAYTSYIQEILTPGVEAAFTKQIRWVPLKCRGDSFTAFFDDLSSNDKRSAEKQKLDIVSCSRMENTRETVHPDVHIVRTVFVDVSMKLICTPLWIYNSMADACQLRHNQNENNDHKEHTREDCIPLAKCSPNVAILFLKSWICNSIDKCKINVNIPLNKSMFKTIKRVRCILNYCLKQNGVQPCDLSDLPLLVSNAGYLLRISDENNLILSEFCDLFPEFGAKFVHKSLILPFRRFEVLFHKLSIELFVSFLEKAIDLHTYKTTEPVKWDKMQAQRPNKIWISDVWKYLEQVENNQLIIALSDWCLFPSLWYKKEPMLLSIKLAFAVVDHKSFSSGNKADCSLGKILEKLTLPCISEYNQASWHLSHLVATRETPDKLAKCLTYHKDHIQHHNLSIEECDTILEFFDKNIGSVDWHAMKCLRLFTTIDNRIVDINEFDQILVLKIESEAVLQGLNELAEKRNTVLLRHNACHTHMYKALNMSLCLNQDDEPSLMEFYVSFVLPHYEFLPENTRIFHLKYVRDKLMKFKSRKLETSLKNLQFLSKLAKKALHRACEFFSPHYSIFSKLCYESELPPFPFNQLEWKEFMNAAGIKTQVSHDQFIVFARQIELQGLNEKSKAQSKELIKHLLSMSIIDLNSAFLEEIRNIKFIVPFVVDRKYALISPQKATNTLIAFSGSVQEKNFQIAWTTHNIIPDDDIPHNWKGVLNDNDNPTTESVVVHLGNVCDSLQKGILKDEPIFVTDLMTHIYRYLL